MSASCITTAINPPTQQRRSRAMVYKVLHLLLGWDYIVWETSCARGIARIYKAANGDVFYWQYKSLKLARKITSRDSVQIWLTCEPSKYLTKPTNTAKKE